MKFSRKSMREFFSSMICTSLVIILFCGLVIAEKNTRCIAFGDKTPFFVFKHEGFRKIFFKIHFMGKDYTFEKNTIY